MQPLMRTALASLVLAALATTGAIAQGAQTKKLSDGRTVLATSRGMTLYVFAGDSIPGRANCSAMCAANWVPFDAGEEPTASGDWTVVITGTGMRSWAYKGRPLYTYMHDTKPGDAKGDGLIGGAFKVAAP